MWRKATPGERCTPGWSTAAARRTRDAWSTPRTMSAARTSTIPVGSTTIPSAGPPWRPRVCKLTSVWPVWASARGLIQDPALRYAVAQGGACGRVPHRGQRTGRGCCLAHQPSPMQWPRFPAGQRAGTLPAGGAGPASALPAGASGSISRSESASALSGGGGPRRHPGVPAP